MNRSTPTLVTTAAAAVLFVWTGPATADPAPAEAQTTTESTPPAADTADLPEPRPVYIEAELPLGFPTPGPAYEVLLKEYPVYRAARAEGGNAFRKLFNHIQSHGIAMTAPVEMTLGTPSEDDPRVARMDMYFMYADPDMGELGPDPGSGLKDQVEVVDLPPVRVLSLGFFGNANRAQVNDALAMLQRQLDDRDDLVAVGPPRLLGYNSPMVPARNRYSEVQIPVGPADAEAPAEEDGQTSEGTAPTETPDAATASAAE